MTGNAAAFEDGNTSTDYIPIHSPSLEIVPPGTFYTICAIDALCSCISLNVSGLCDEVPGNDTSPPPPIRLGYFDDDGNLTYNNGSPRDQDMSDVEIARSDGFQTTTRDMADDLKEDDSVFEIGSRASVLSEDEDDLPMLIPIPPSEEDSRDGSTIPYDSDHNSSQYGDIPDSPPIDYEQITDFVDPMYASTIEFSTPDSTHSVSPVRISILSGDSDLRPFEEVVEFSMCDHWQPAPNSNGLVAVYEERHDVEESPSPYSMLDVSGMILPSGMDVWFRETCCFSDCCRFAIAVLSG